MRPLKHGDAIAELPTIGVVWYQEVFINTAATAVVSVGVGNGTSVTRISVTQNEGQFTVENPSAAGSSGSLALTQINYQPTVTVAGAILFVDRCHRAVQTLTSIRTSPTAYNVFTGMVNEHLFGRPSVADNRQRIL